MNEERKTYKFFKKIMLILFTAFTTFLITSLFMYNYFQTNGISDGNQVSSKENIDSAIKKYRDIIDKYYIGEIDEEKLKEGAIKGYVEALGDPYSEFIPQSEMSEYAQDILGNFVGIGIYMAKDTEADRVQVIAPIKNTPAEKAGIQPGDYIIKVDGVEYKADDLSKMADAIKGEEGTTVKLDILREAETISYEIKREKIITNPVTSKVLTNNIGYIEIPSFDEGTANYFKEEFKKLQQENIKSLVIDLRNNGGGIVDEATQIADYIVDKDSTILITKNKEGKEKERKAKENPIINIPIVVLVNKHSASASEILAGALKDLKKATLVGTTTYGKGVIQSVITLKDGSGLKITSEEYVTPSREKIDKKGIEPHETVELPEGIKNIMQLKEEEDTQLQKAIEILKNKI